MTTPTQPFQIGDSSRSADQDGISIIGAVTLLLRYAHVIAGTASFALLVAMIAALIRPPVYVADSSFLSKNSGSGHLSQYAGLASQFGVALPGSGGGESVAFYAALVEAPVVLTSLALDTFDVEEPLNSVNEGNLIELLRIRGDTPEDRLQAAYRDLRDRITVHADVESGMVSLSVAAPRPDLAAAMNGRLLELIDEFNLMRRQREAAAEKAFFQSRVESASAELRQAEKKLEEFLEQNRQYQSSPQLTFELSRLQRRVDLRQQIYISLAQAAEQASIEEARNTPVITIVDPAEGFIEKERPNVLLSMLLGAILGIIVGTGLALLFEMIRRKRKENPDEYQALLRATNEALRRLKLRRGQGGDELPTRQAS